MPQVNGVVYGYCGILCSFCRAYIYGKCPGCGNSYTVQCKFISCAVSKGVQSCLSCRTFPCSLHIEGFDWDTEELGKIRWRVYSDIFARVFSELFKEPENHDQDQQPLL